MNYTSIEQSKKLIELGLSPKSADMRYYCYQSLGEDFYMSYPDVIEDSQVLSEKDIPCWSIGALLELMPPGVRISKNCDGNYNLGYRNFDTKEYLYMIDACFEMTVWLLENNHIKKEINMKQEDKDGEGDS